MQDGMYSGKVIRRGKPLCCLHCSSSHGERMLDYWRFESLFVGLAEMIGDFQVQVSRLVRNISFSQH